jgi:hypothetical protein
MVKKLFALVLYILLSPVKFLFAQQQNTTVIVLQSPQDQTKAKEFFIAEVNDARKNKAVLGKLQPYATATTQGTYAVNFAGGSKALTDFLKNSVTFNRSLRAVIVNINELSIEEVPAEKGAVKGSVKVDISFELRGTYVPIPLTVYATTTTYQRAAGPARYLEPIISKTLKNGISFFDNWINEQAGKNIKLAKSVKLSFTDYDDKADGDTIYYKPNRPLAWSDFTGRPPRASKHGAEIFSYIGYDQDVDFKDEIIYVKLSLKSWVAKSASWVLPGMQSNYALNHEQRHFDITRLVAEHFENRLKATLMAPDTFEGEINTAYIDTLRELAKLQREYDAETSHGANVSAQEQSNIRIDNDLAANGIKP